MRSLFSFVGQGSLENATFVAAKVSMALVVASAISGYVWARFFQNSETPKVTLHSACGLSQLGFNEGLGVAPWNFCGPQWIACIIFIGGFVLRKYLLPRITDGLYDDLTEAKKEKVSNYMLEILGTTAAFVLCSFLGFFELLFHPEKYSHPSPDQTYNLGLGGNILMCCFVTTYSLELAFDTNMRIGLALHHWTAIGLTLWAMPALYNLNGDTMTVRAFFFTVIVYVNRAECLHRNVDVPPKDLLATNVLCIRSLLCIDQSYHHSPESVGLVGDVRFDFEDSTQKRIGILIVAGTPASKLCSEFHTGSHYSKSSRTCTECGQEGCRGSFTTKTGISDNTQEDICNKHQISHEHLLRKTMQRLGAHFPHHRL